MFSQKNHRENLFTLINCTIPDYPEGNSKLRHSAKARRRIENGVKGNVLCYVCTCADPYRVSSWVHTLLIKVLIIESSLSSSFLNNLLIKVSVDAG